MGYSIVDVDESRAQDRAAPSGSSAASSACEAFGINWFELPPEH